MTDETQPPAEAVAVPDKTLTSEVDPVMRAKLEQIDALYDGVYPLLAKLYDAKAGGFYASSSTRSSGKFAPDIEDTAFVLTFLKDDGLIETMPPDVKQKMIGFFQSRQDAKTGFFVEPAFPQARGNQRAMARALRFAMVGLEILGAKPLYPLPGAREGGAEMDYLQSPDAFRAWLEARPWNSSWKALDELYQQTGIIKSLPAEKQKVLLPIAEEVLRAKQDPQSGMAGEGPLIVRISGAAKLDWFAAEFDLKIPRPDALYATTLGWFESQPTDDYITHIRNATELTADLEPLLAQPMPMEKKQLVLNTALRFLKPFAQKDGGFSMATKEFRLGPFDLKAGNVKTAQSDLNGTAMAQKTRASAYHLAGVKAPPMKGADQFWAMATRTQ